MLEQKEQEFNESEISFKKTHVVKVVLTSLVSMQNLANKPDVSNAFASEPKVTKSSSYQKQPTAVDPDKADKSLKVKKMFG